MTINCFLQTEKNDPQKVALFYDRVRFYILFFDHLFFGYLFFGYLFFGCQFFGCLIKGAIDLCYKLGPWLRRIVYVRVADLLQYLLYG